MADAGQGFLGPVHARQDLADAPFQGALALVKPVDVVAFAGKFPVQLAEFDVAAYGHPVADVVAQQVQPLGEVAFIQQLRFVEKELLDLVFQQHLGDARPDGRHTVLPVWTDAPLWARSPFELPWRQVASSSQF